MPARLRPSERLRKILGTLDDFAKGPKRVSQRGESGILPVGTGDPSRIFALLMHADRSEHAVIHRDHDSSRAVLRRRREFLRIRHETAVAGKAHHLTFRMLQFCGNRHRQSVTHCTAGRRQFRGMLAIAIKAITHTV